MIVDPAAYPTYREFAKTASRDGCVVQACAVNVIGSPSVNVLIEPDGCVRVLSTIDQVFNPWYKAVGGTFPQQTVPPVALYHATVALGHACYDSGVVGYFNVDFVVFHTKGAVRLWGVDIKLGCASSLAAYKLFDYLLAGTFHSMDGTYLVPADTISTPGRRAEPGTPDDVVVADGSPGDE